MRVASNPVFIRFLFPHAYVTSYYPLPIEAVYNLCAFDNQLYEARGETDKRDSHQSRVHRKLGCFRLLENDVGIDHVNDNKKELGLKKKG
jgi:hypothetical protein